LTELVAGLAAALSSTPLGSIAAATLAGALTSQVLDNGFQRVYGELRGTGTARQVIHTALPVALAAVPLYAPVVALLAFTYEEVSPLTLPLFLVPALAAQRLFGLYQEQRRLTQYLSSANGRLEKAN
jgi:hypothetical protein